MFIYTWDKLVCIGSYYMGNELWYENKSGMVVKCGMSLWQELCWWGENGAADLGCSANNLGMEAKLSYLLWC